VRILLDSLSERLRLLAFLDDQIRSLRLVDRLRKRDAS
jgi:hypothetical protein